MSTKNLSLFGLMFLFGFVVYNLYDELQESHVLERNLSAMHDWAAQQLPEARVVDVACFRKKNHCVAAMMDHQENYVYVGATCIDSVCTDRR